MTTLQLRKQYQLLINQYMVSSSINDKKSVVAKMKQFEVTHNYDPKQHKQIKL